jgi:starch synthase
MTAAIYYHPEAYTTSGPKLMGRNAAGESFLRGFLAHSKAQEFWVQVQKPEHAQHFAQTVKAYGRSEPVQFVVNATLGTLRQPETVFYPGPGIGEHAFQRSFFGHGGWSLCGITHTLCSAGAMDAIVDLVTAPTQPWDALICTSTAGRSAVQQMLQAQADYLSWRLGARRVVLPRLPIIPLGVHVADFTFTSEQRRAAREALGADEKTHIVLFAGRLSFHAKAHPLAMYQALEMAALRLPPGDSLLLIEFGVFPNDHIQRAFEAASALACPHVRVHRLDGRSDTNRLHAWAGADIFASLSDNLQETFGLTPVEAMAAGLPVVVSDWDGYKDTVRDGVDGFRVPTIMPQAGLGADLALRHALEVDTYDMYCGHTCSLVAVDVEACAKAFIELTQSIDLRKRMGAAGRERAMQTYDWRAIIPQYEALWSELNDVRKAEASALPPLVHPWPARMDPFQGFNSYPSRTLAPDTTLALVDPDAQQAYARYLQYSQLAMVDFAKVVLPAEDEVRHVLGRIEQTPAKAVELVSGLDADRQAFVFRSLVWLVKLGVLRVVPSPRT